MQYFVVHHYGYTPEHYVEFMTKVQELLDKGYRPQGGVAISTQMIGGPAVIFTSWAQALIRDMPNA